MNIKNQQINIYKVFDLVQKEGNKPKRKVLFAITSNYEDISPSMMHFEAIVYGDLALNINNYIEKWVNAELKLLSFQNKNTAINNLFVCSMVIKSID